MPNRLRTLALLVLSLVLVGVPGRAFAAPGDPVVVADDTLGTPGTFFKAIDRIRFDGTAEQITPGNAIAVGNALAFTEADAGVMVGLDTIAHFRLSSGQLIAVNARGAGDLRGVALANDGSILATDLGLSNGTAADGRVVGINSATGAVTPISSGDLLTNPLGIAVAESGAIFVTNADGNGQGQVIEVNPVSGAQRLVSSGPLVAPWGLAFMADGELVLADESYNHAFMGALVRVNPLSGQQSARFLENLAGPIENATGVAVTDSGEVLVSERNSGQVDRVNLESGAAQLIGAGAPSPLDVEVEPGAGPSTDITGGPGIATQDTTPEFSFVPARYGAISSCKIDSEAAVPCRRSFVTPELALGSHTFRVSSSVFGAEGPVATRRFVVDPAVPGTLIDEGPEGPTNDPTPTFAFEAPAGGTSFFCSLDGAAESPCDSPITLGPLADGPHTFRVRADNDATGVSVAFILDATPPSATITSGPPEGAAVANPQPTFTFSSSESPATFRCRLDTVGVPCTSSFTPAAPLSEAEHTLSVVALDAFGNVDPSPEVRHFTVDVTRPVTTITGGPNGVSTAAMPTFTFSASEAGVFFECSIDSLTLSACESPFTTAPLSQGPHTFRVKATDAAGNVDEPLRSRDFSVDTTVPETTITSGPSGPGNDSAPVFEFESDVPGSTFSCGFAGTILLQNCQSPFPFAVLPDNLYTFEVIAIAPNGNPDPTPATRSFEIDTLPPVTQLTSTPPALSNDPTPEFRFTSVDQGATFRCQIDAAATAPCTSPFTAVAQADGSHTFTVTAVDAAGNTEPNAPHFTFTVDTTAPQPRIDSGPAGDTSEARPIFAVSANEKASLACSFDGAAPTPCGPTAQPTAALSLGAHSLTVTATDQAGNRSVTSARRDFRVTAPGTPPSHITLRGKIRKGKLTVTASLVPNVDASLAVTVTARAGLKRLSKRLVLRLHAGSGSASLRLPRGVKRVQVKAAYPGDKEHPPASSTINVRASRR